MLRFTMSLAATISVFHLTANADAAEEAKPFDFKVRYAVVLDNAEPFTAEVTCRSDKDCVLVDHENPDIRLTLEIEQGLESSFRLRAACDPRPCALWPEYAQIIPRQKPRLEKIQLSQRDNPSPTAVLLLGRRLGDIFIAY